jgi:NADPH-dependent ferric siderophore reductase
MSTARTRREPHPFRRARVTRVEARSPRLTRITLAGEELDGFDPGLPAASLRLLLPEPGSGDVELPAWNGNEFLRADGARPLIRTLTPLAFDADTSALEVEVVLHGHGALSAWAETVTEGDPVAVSGTGRGYDVEPEARSYLLAGDESALPALTTLLPALPPTAEALVVVEIAAPEAQVSVPHHPRAELRWCESRPGARPGAALVEAVQASDLDLECRVWAAGEAASMLQIRRVLFEVRGLPRGQAVVRGYWKHGRSAEPAD